MKLEDIKNILTEDKNTTLQNKVNKYHEAEFGNPINFRFDRYKISNGEIEYNDELVIETSFLVNGVLRFPFATCKAIDIDTRELKSFKNFPYMIWPGNGYAFRATFNGPGKRITSWEGFPKDITGEVRLDNNMFDELSYSNYHKVVNMLNGKLKPHNHYVGPLLSFLMIKKFKGFPISSMLNYASAFVILNDHLEGERDVLDCQEELIQAGLKEYAKL